MLNTWTPNGQALNGSSSTVIQDWSLAAPVERRVVYVLDIGSVRLPMSSAQATMRLSGRSFLQAVVPGGDAYIEALEGLTGEVMRLKMGYRYPDDSFSPLEQIAQAPFEILRQDEGVTSHTLTLSGYGEREATPSAVRELPNPRYRSVGTAGRRRVRCDIDLFLRPGHTALDSDGVSFRVGIIQYFINARSDFMEVMQDG